MSADRATALMVPAWPLPPGVRAASTLRYGAGASREPFDTFNLGDHVGDDGEAVAANRRTLAEHLGLGPGGRPVWLRQVHGTAVAELDGVGPDAPAPVADASVVRGVGVACALLTADCLPVLMCDHAGTVVGAAHAGWRGLAKGVIEATVQAMGVSPSRLTVWLGPCISAGAFEVGPEVRAALLAQGVAGSAQAFRPGDGDRWFADLHHLARQRLLAVGVARSHVYLATGCTYAEPGRFFSYRRDGACGRMASLIWRDSASFGAT